jgi:hypothetical protein
MAFGRRNAEPAQGPKGLAVPPAAQVSPDAMEIFRAWIVDGGLQVSLQRGFDDSRMWGILLADVARHASRVYAREGLTTEADAMRNIRSLFDAELDRPTDTGSTDAIQ